MESCLPYLVAGGAVVFAFWYTQQPMGMRFSDATACSARAAAAPVDGDTSTTNDDPMTGRFESFVDEGEGETIKPPLTSGSLAPTLTPSITAMDEPLSGSFSGIEIPRIGASAGPLTNLPDADTLSTFLPFNAPTSLS